MTELEKHNAKWQENYRVEGMGLGNVFTHHPCPFCAEPDWMVAELLEFQAVMAKEHVCSSCHRGAKGLFARLKSGIQMEIVQTCGPDQPEWLVPKMRRL